MIAAVAYLLVLPAVAWVFVWQQRADEALLNVSYDPTRELWRDLNRAFREEYEKETGKRVAINMSHASSGGQARAVIDGLEADVVSLAMWTDVDAIRRAGMIAPGWDRAPRRSLPYHSTLVFVVRAGNPKNIHDWDDLVRGDISIITPNPKTSGNGRLSLLAAWGAVLKKGGTPEDAERFVSEIYRRTPVLDTGARGSAMTFAQKGIGDVHLTWESEGVLEVEESKNRLEIVYPKWSIRAEPPVTLVDSNVDRRGTREVSQRYVDFLYTPRGQEIIARHYYRPMPEFDGYRDRTRMKDINLFDISLIWKDWKKQDWDEVHRVFFANNGVFDRIYQTKK